MYLWFITPISFENGWVVPVWWPCACWVVRGLARSLFSRRCSPPGEGHSASKCSTSFSTSCCAVQQQTPPHTNTHIRTCIHTPCISILPPSLPPSTSTPHTHPKTRSVLSAWSESKSIQSNFPSSNPSALPVAKPRKTSCQHPKPSAGYSPMLSMMLFPQ